MTQPFVLPDGAFHVNADAAKGSLAVEILQADGKPFGKALKSAPIEADAIDVSVAMKNFAPTALAGQSVRLKFTMENAKLFSFWFQ